MEERITATVTIVTQGERCELDEAALKEWYLTHIAGLFDPAYGTPKITVDVKREDIPE